MTILPFILLYLSLYVLFFFWYLSLSLTLFFPIMYINLIVFQVPLLMKCFFLFIISSTLSPYQTAIPTSCSPLLLILFSSFLNAHLFLSLYLHLCLSSTFSSFLPLISISALVLVFPSVSHTVESGRSILMSGPVVLV